MDIRVDPDKITIGDIPNVLRMAAGRVDDELLVELIEFGDRIVFGGIKQYPIRQMQTVFGHIARQIEEVINPKGLDPGDPQPSVNGSGSTSSTSERLPQNT